MILGTAPLADQSAAGTAKVDGDEQALHEFIALLDNVELWFDIVTP